MLKPQNMSHAILTNVRSSKYECNRKYDCMCVFAPCCVHVFALLIVMSQASFLKSKKIPPLSDLLSLINMKDLVNRHVQECREYKKFNPKLYSKPLSPSKNHTLYLHLLSNVHSLLVLSLGLPLFLSDIFYWIPM